MLSNLNFQDFISNNRHPRREWIQIWYSKIQKVREKKIRKLNLGEGYWTKCSAFLYRSISSWNTFSSNAIENLRFSMWSKVVETKKNRNEFDINCSIQAANRGEHRIIIGMRHADWSVCVKVNSNWVRVFFFSFAFDKRRNSDPGLMMPLSRSVARIYCENWIVRFLAFNIIYHCPKMFCQRTPSNGQNSITARRTQSIQSANSKDGYSTAAARTTTK